MSKDNQETSRITIAIAIIATFLTLILNLNKFIPEGTSSVLELLKLLVYTQFAIICLIFFLYVLFKARDLKYYKEESDHKANDYSVVIQYILLWIFNRKSLKNNQTILRKRFNQKARDNYKFFYDEGIRQSFIFPYNSGLYLLMNYVPKWITPFFNLKEVWLNIISLAVIIVGLLLINVIMNIFRYKITGEQ